MLADSEGLSPAQTSFKESESKPMSDETPTPTTEPAPADTKPKTALEKQQDKATPVYLVPAPSAVEEPPVHVGGAPTTKAQVQDLVRILRDHAHGQEIHDALLAQLIGIMEAVDEKIPEPPPPDPTQPPGPPEDDPVKATRKMLGLPETPEAAVPPPAEESTAIDGDVTTGEPAAQTYARRSRKQ